MDVNKEGIILLNNFSGYSFIYWSQIIHFLTNHHNSLEFITKLRFLELIEQHRRHFSTESEPIRIDDLNPPIMDIVEEVLKQTDALSNYSDNKDTSITAVPMAIQLA